MPKKARKLMPKKARKLSLPRSRCMPKKPRKPFELASEDHWLAREFPEYEQGRTRGASNSPWADAADLADLTSYVNKLMSKPKKDGWYEHGQNCLEYLEHNFGGVQPTLEQAARHATSVRKREVR